MTIHPKVAASTAGSGLGGALTIVVVWLLSLFGISVPSDVNAALVVLLGALCAFAAGYFTPNPTMAAAAPQSGAQ